MSDDRVHRITQIFTISTQEGFWNTDRKYNSKPGEYNQHHAEYKGLSDCIASGTRNYRYIQSDWADGRVEVEKEGTQRGKQTPTHTNPTQ